MNQDDPRELLHAQLRSLGRDKIALVVGASRGMGRQIALDLALVGGYTAAVAAKTRSKDIKNANPDVDGNSNESTVDTVAALITRSGGTALALTVDVRDKASVEKMVSDTIKAFGKLDVLVYNPGAIWWASIKDTPYSRFDLMQRVNPGGLYACVQAFLPHMPSDGRIVIVSPPIYRRFVRGKTAYAMGKFGMSALTLGLGIDFEREGVVKKAVTSLWPAAAIESAATRYNGSQEAMLRKATIFSDATLLALALPPSIVNGTLWTDEDLIRAHVTSLPFAGDVDALVRGYALVPGTEPRRIMPAQFPSLRVEEEDDEGVRMDSAVVRRGKGKGAAENARL